MSGRGGTVTKAPEVPTLLAWRGSDTVLRAVFSRTEVCARAGGVVRARVMVKALSARMCDFIGGFHSVECDFLLDSLSAGATDCSAGGTKIFDHRQTRKRKPTKSDPTTDARFLISALAVNTLNSEIRISTPRPPDYLGELGTQNQLSLDPSNGSVCSLA
jgi:hypothetical protein